MVRGRGSRSSVSSVVRYAIEWGVYGGVRDAPGVAEGSWMEACYVGRAPLSVTRLLDGIATDRLARGDGRFTNDRWIGRGYHPDATMAA